MKTLLVGATSPIGRAFLQLHSDPEGVFALTRHRLSGVVPKDRLLPVDLLAPNVPLVRAAGPFQCVVTIAPLPLCLELLAGIAPPERVVALSSNNVALFSGSGPYSAHREAEERLLADHPDSLVLQSTAITGDPRDIILSDMFRKVRSGRRVVLPGLDTLQAPIHFRDVAGALLAAARPDGPPPGRWSVSGPEVLSYREMIGRAEAVAGRRARTLDLPPRVARGLGRTLGSLGTFRSDPRVAALLRAGRDRLPVAPPLPGFAPGITVAETFRRLSVELEAELAA